jgi:hypothetical protein
MNQHERRRERKLNRENKFYSGYVAHLPRVPIDGPLEPGRVYHMVFHHDEWCAFYDGRPCNCNPIITRHIEPRRS